MVDGASSETSTKIASFESLARLRVERGMPSIHFDKSTTISDGIHIPQTYNVSKGFDRISQFNEAVAEVDKGMLEKREKQLKEMGFKIKSRTSYSKNDPPYKRILLHIKK